MKTFYEIMEEKDLNNLTPLEYAIWFLESATGASGAQQAAQDLARITAERDALNLLLWDISKCVEPDEDNIFLPVSSEIARHIFDKVSAALKQSS